MASLPDVEDIAIPKDSVPVPGSSAVALVRNTVRQRRTNATPVAAPAGVPGTQCVWVKTFGCSHNVSDGEVMAGLLDTYGYRLLPDAEKDTADLWLLNSCTVKDPSQSVFMNLVTACRGVGRPVVVAGCVPQGDRALAGLEDVSVVGVLQIDRVVEVVEETLRGNVVRLLSRSSLPSLDLPKIRRNPLVEIVPLSTGCLGACTYCKTRHARGKLGSYAPEAIVSRVQQAIAEGVTEIWLSSEDTGAYGRDIGTNLPHLLSAVTDALPSHVMLRLGMTNPPFILEHLDAVAAALNHPNVFSFLHVPVQSGSNPVLTAMNREYTVEDFVTVCDHLLRNVPGVNISTDIICGFPGETEEQWQETMALMRKYRLTSTHISQFYPRPGTPAAAMKQHLGSVKKARSRELSELVNSYNPFPALVGTTVKVWVGAETSGPHTVCHTKNYTKVLVPLDDSLVGCSAMVHVEACSRWHVTGRVVGKPTLPGTVLPVPILGRRQAAAGVAAAPVPAPVPAQADKSRWWEWASVGVVIFAVLLLFLRVVALVEAV